jgi:putative ABC transport system ATP-binding protein
MLDAVGLAGLGLPQRSAAASCSAWPLPAPWCIARLLLADEPTGNLDPGTAALVMDALVEQPQHGAAMVLVTHSWRLPGAPTRLRLTPEGLVPHASPA